MLEYFKFLKIVKPVKIEIVLVFDLTIGRKVI